MSWMDVIAIVVCGSALGVLVVCGFLLFVIDH